MITLASCTLATLYSMTRGICRHISFVVTWNTIQTLVLHFRDKAFRYIVSITQCVSVKLTESRYRTTFPGCVSTFFKASPVGKPSGGRVKPLSRPTSMMAMPVAFRPEPSDRLQRVTRQCEDVRKLQYVSSYCILAHETILLIKFNVFIFITCAQEQIVNHQKIKW